MIRINQNNQWGSNEKRIRKKDLADVGESRLPNKRRKILGSLSGGVAVAIWHKPVIDAMVLPAHAVTSQPEPVTTVATVSGIDLPDLINIDIDLPVAHPDDSPPTVTEVILELDIQHTFQGDFVITLTSPDGTTSTLVNRIGTGDTTFGCPEDDLMLTLDDSATATLPVVVADCPNGVLTGTFTTGGGLNAFIDETPDGTWVLSIDDEAGFDAGFLNSATLSVTCE